MTEQSGRADLARAREQLDELCVKVGFARVEDPPRLEGGLDAPDGIALWSSAYARVLLWPCRENESIDVAAATGEAWFDEVLVQSERQTHGRPIDGYLVLALPSAPNDEVLQHVRRLELSARVCRKHLIWPARADDPDADGQWRRVADVTVLGLPDAEATSAGELLFPQMDTEAQAVWDDLVSLGVSATVLRDEVG